MKALRARTQCELFASSSVAVAEAPSRSDELRCTLLEGDYRDVLEHVECDALLVDTRHRLEGHQGWKTDDVRDLVGFWAPRARGWICAITHADLHPAWRDAMRACGRIVYAPLPLVIKEKGPPRREGPVSESAWLVVGRPRSLSSWRSLPGSYVGESAEGSSPMWLMRALIRDYSEPGALVCDPCAQTGQILLAARLEGRSSIGAESSRDQAELARARLMRPFTLTFPWPSGEKHDEARVEAVRPGSTDSRTNGSRS